MATYGAKDIPFVLVDGADIRGAISAVNFSGPEEVLEESHPVGVEWVEQSPVGLKRWSLQLQGWWMDGDVDAVAAIAGQAGAQRIICTGFEGNTIGAELIGLAGAVQSRATREAARGALTKMTVDMPGSGEYDDGVILHPLATETADGSTEGDAVDAGAGSLDGGVAYLQVTDLVLDGYDDVTITILASDDDVTYVELDSFAAVTQAPSAQRVAVSGAVGRYLACEWAFSGTGGDPSVTFVAGFARY